MYKFALIGCGNVARKHVKEIVKNGKLVAVCDVVEERADALAEEHEAEAYYSIDELLEGAKDIDVVVVCTPNGCHAEHCIKSLQAGFHVLCESPLCLTGAAAWQMIETQKYCGRQLWVVHAAAGNLTLADVQQSVKTNGGEQLFNFELNCVAGPANDDWRETAFPGGGALPAYFAPAIDLVSYLFGTIAEANGNGTVDKEGDVEVKMKSGVQGRIKWLVKEGAEGKSMLELRNFEQPVWSGEVDSYAGASDYHELYAQMKEGLGNDGQVADSLFAGTRTVEAIEKIYASVSSTPSSR